MTRLNKKNLNRAEWLEARKNSIGGSESSVLIGLGLAEPLNKYMSYFELWGIKTGLYEKPDQSNKYTLIGNKLEDTIADLWCYWQGDMDSVVRNATNETEVRTCQNCNFILYHKKHPFISANLDRVIPDQKDGRGKGILEIKTGASWVTKEWKSGIPPQYIIQLQHYLMVTGYKWGEIAMFEMDTRQLSVIEFERDESIIKNIEESCVEFWDRVEKTKEAIKKGESTDPYMPPMEPTEAWKEFVNEFWEAKPETTLTLQGEEAFSIIDSILTINDKKKEIKELEKKIIENENIIKSHIKDNEVLILKDSVNELGVCTWKMRKDGKRDYLRPKLNETINA